VAAIFQTSVAETRTAAATAPKINTPIPVAIETTPITMSDRAIDLGVGLVLPISSKSSG